MSHIYIYIYIYTYQYVIITQHTVHELYANVPTFLVYVQK